MNWIRSEFGDAKANWLWKRFGVLAVRTLLSIMPTLARDYDFHFKGFNNVPVTPPPNTSLYSTPQQSDRSVRSNGSSSSSRSRNRSRSQAKKVKTSATNSDGDQDEDDDHDEDDGDRQNYQINDSTAAATEESGEEGAGSEEELKPSSTDDGDEVSPTVCENWRGSRSHSHSLILPHSRSSCRCFEVLGIDVMVDSQLRPWLIEFNHLPR